MLYSNMGSEMTPSLISYGGLPQAPPMGATESDNPWKVGLSLERADQGFIIESRCTKVKVEVL